MNKLENYFNNNPGRLIDKWHHYFEIYERHFNRFINKQPVILEIGVFQGGSLQMWRNYFGEGAKIFGIDIDPRCKGFEEENIKIFIGSQSDQSFLGKVVNEIPPIDILIDDGGHFMKQQIISFECLFKHIQPNGIYLCEDCHTSYWPRYGGGLGRNGSFIEYSKNWIDMINAYHTQSRRLKVNEFTKSAKSIHYYDSVVVIEKGEVSQPISSTTGVRSFSYQYNGKFLRKIANAAKKRINGLFNLLNLPYYFE